MRKNVIHYYTDVAVFNLDLPFFPL